MAAEKTLLIARKNKTPALSCVALGPVLFGICKYNNPIIKLITIVCPNLALRINGFLKAFFEALGIILYVE